MVLEKNITSEDQRTTSDSEDHSVASSDEQYDYDDPLNYHTEYVDEHNPKGLRRPTIHEAETLRRVLGRAPYAAYLICLVELAERGSYYGVTGILANFIQRPLPPGSTTGAPVSKTSSQNAGALGLGVTTSSALTLLLTFLAYVVPLYGGFIADTKLGKFKAIWLGVIAGFFAHIFLIIAALPSVIASGKALAPTIFGIIILAFGTGFIKPNLLPLLMDQYQFKIDVVKVLPSGEKVIVDRQKTIERMTLVFYWAINIGAFFQVATSYCERRVGFWLAFFVPIIMYLIVPFVLFFLQSKLIKEKPDGSVLSNAWRVFSVTFRGNWFRRYRNGTLWEYARPSNMLARGEKWYKEKRQKGITWDDQWVIDIKQTVESCKIFLYFPMFNLTDGGIGNAQNAQSGAMITKGIPNDLYNNFNPLTIIILIPILDYLVYPFLRKHKIPFHPVWRITFGFFLSATSQVIAAILQHFIYKTSPCGNQASTCDTVSNVNGWWEVVLYVLGAAGECFANTTAYELAYTRSPPQMKGLVMAMFLFTSAISAAIGEALTAALVDPLLVRTFIGTAAFGYLFTVGFFFHFRNLHKKMAKEQAEKEELQRAKDRQQDTAILTGSEVIVHGGLEKNEALVPVTSIKSAVGK